MTAELMPNPDENDEKEIDFMLGTYAKGTRITKIPAPVSSSCVCGNTHFDQCLFLSQSIRSL